MIFEVPLTASISPGFIAPPSSGVKAASSVASRHVAKTAQFKTTRSLFAADFFTGKRTHQIHDGTTNLRVSDPGKRFVEL